MSDHSKVLVPLESWCYSSPELRYQGHIIDVGLMAEALIYYDQVLINLTNAPQLAELISWFVAQNKYSDFLSLLEEGTLQIYDYSFITAAIEKDDSYSIWNIDDPVSQKPNSFEERFLYNKSIDNCFRNSRERVRLYKTLRGKVIEVKAEEFGPAINNAREDFLNPERSALLIQSLLDEIHAQLQWKKPPKVTAVLRQVGDKSRIEYSVDLAWISRKLGKNLNFHMGTPLTGIAHCNRLLWSAAQLNCDLYLGNPMGTLVGDKLFESQSKIIKVNNIIESLTFEVEFPAIRELINNGKLNLDDILSIRKNAEKFRNWLQNESERDRNAIIAYHTEVAKDSGFTKASRTMLNIFGIIGGAAIGSAVESKYPGLPGAAIGAVASGGAEYLFDVARKFNQEWKPIVFGNWMENRVELLLDDLEDKEEYE